jgi:hypothetical protein
MSSVKFFLNAKGGSLAFLKEMDSPKWSASLLLEDLAAPYVPTTLEESLDLSKSRVAVLLLKPSDPEAVYTIRVMGYMKASEDMAGYYLVDDGVYENLSGNYAIGVNAQLLDNLSIAVDEITAGTLSV